MNWIKKKYQETKEGIKADWEERKKTNAEIKKANAEISVASREEYYKARKEQQIILARKKAILEREQRERQLKAKYSPIPTPKITSNLNSFQMSMQPSGMMSSSYFATAKPKTLPKIVKTKKKKRKSKKKKGGKK